MTCRVLKSLCLAQEGTGQATVSGQGHCESSDGRALDHAGTRSAASGPLRVPTRKRGVYYCSFGGRIMIKLLILEREMYICK